MKNYKLSKQQFLDAYGKDDSSRALINFYFQERKDAGLGTIAGLALATVSLIIANNPTTSGSVYDVPGYDYLLFLLSVPLTVYGFVKWTSFSRKKLLRLLKDYYDGKSIPDRILKKKEFNDFLTKEIDPFH